MYIHKGVPDTMGSDPNVSDPNVSRSYIHIGPKALAGVLR